MTLISSRHLEEDSQGSELGAGHKSRRIKGMGDIQFGEESRRQGGKLQMFEGLAHWRGLIRLVLYSSRAEVANFVCKSR